MLQLFYGKKFSPLFLKKVAHPAKMTGQEKLRAGQILGRSAMKPSKISNSLARRKLKQRNFARFPRCASYPKFSNARYKEVYLLINE
ncbi:MAG: hypothetical protein PHE24_01330 [Patescibacteria group bacterium]|nr:hypothetical protein [Patescibacteria group bacterium]